MHRIPCPWCGVRDEAEFQYQGDASVRRPPADATVEEFHRYVHVRINPAGWHREWWHHVGGCRLWLQVVRHTGTHEIHAAARAGDPLPLPEDGPAS